MKRLSAFIEYNSKSEKVKIEPYKTSILLMLRSFLPQILRKKVNMSSKTLQSFRNLSQSNRSHLFRLRLCLFIGWENTCKYKLHLYEIYILAYVPSQYAV